MISITIEKKEGSYHRLLCKGHAGFAEHGKDIVCAAASVLVINTLNSIEALANTDYASRSDSEKGLIEAIFPDDLNEKAILLLDSLVMGLETIKSQYGKRYIDFNMKEVALC